jgi:branched-chain amino acid transport system permease protein
MSPDRALKAVIAAVAAWLVAGAVLPDGAPLGIVLLGVVLGSLHALTAVGLVLVHRGARIVNFAQAEIGGLAAAVVTIAVANLDVPYFAALGLGMAAALATGWLVDATVVRRLFTAPRLVLTVATLGIAQLLGALQIALPTWFSDLDLFDPVRSPFDADVTIGPVVFTGDHLLVVLSVPAVLLALGLFLTRHRVGLAVQAAADSPDRAQLLGIPVRRLSRLVWMLSAGLSGLAAMLAAPILGPNLGSVAGPQALLVPLAAAVVARMERLGVAVVAAIGLGVFRELFFWSSPRSATVDVGVFVVVLVALLLQRRGFERAGASAVAAISAVREVRPVPAVLARLPEVRVPRQALAAGVAVLAVVVPAQLSASQLSFSTTLVILAILAVSLVVLTGWAGQVSLGQFALAGVGGAVTAVLLVDAGADLFLALAAGSVAAGAAAVAVGIPAVRIPGLLLGVTTLALSVPVATWLLNPTYFEDLTPSAIDRPHLLQRYELDSPLRWYFVCLAVLGAAIAVVRRLRASRPGRAIVAVRDNERAAAALSITPNRARLMAFAVSGLLAGLAGGLYVVTLRAVPFNGFSPNASIELFTMVVIGGLGSLPGAIVGAAYVWSAQFFLHGAASLLATGAGLLLLLLVLPGGLGQAAFDVRDRYLGWVARRHGLDLAGFSAPAAVEEPPEAAPVAPPVAGLLVCEGLHAAYGRVPVLFGVDLAVDDGAAVAVLGTNGAGKSTLVRVVSGLLPATAGAVRFAGVDVTGLRPEERVAVGMVIVPGGRDVFGSLTVDDNLRTAEWSRRHDRAFIERTRAQIGELFPALVARGAARASDLSGGEQQMLAIAQALLCRPRLLVIDELSLGLAPGVVDELVAAIEGLRADGLAVIVVEQSLERAGRVADAAVFLERGQVRYAGDTRGLARREDLVRSVFFGQAVDRRATRHRAVGIGATPPALEARGLTVRFGGVTALEQTSLVVAPNEVVGVIGSNGAGKTTLLDVCSGFLPPAAGRVLLGGTDVTDLPAAGRAARGMGRVFQDGRLFPGLTVHETIAVALERHVEVRDPIACGLGLASAERSERAVLDRVDELVGLLGLGRYRNAFTAELSAGTRRVVQIACAMAHEPSVLLLDEPSSGIAQAETEALAELLVQLRDTTRAAFVVVEHDIPLVASISDRLVCLHLGTPIADGPPGLVLDDPAVVAAYLGSPRATEGRARRSRR